ncbi:MAG: hypothetical protein QXS53_01250, partial [Candidatus Anstonellales archaeon]
MIWIVFLIIITHSYISDHRQILGVESTYSINNNQITIYVNITDGNSRYIPQGMMGIFRYTLSDGTERACYFQIGNNGYVTLNVGQFRSANYYLLPFSAELASNPSINNPYIEFEVKFMTPPGESLNPCAGSPTNINMDMIPSPSGVDWRVWYRTQGKLFNIFTGLNFSGSQNNDALTILFLALLGLGGLWLSKNPGFLGWLDFSKFIYNPNDAYRIGLYANKGNVGFAPDNIMTIQDEAEKELTQKSVVQSIGETYTKTNVLVGQTSNALVKVGDFLDRAVLNENVNKSTNKKRSESTVPEDLMSENTTEQEQKESTQPIAEEESGKTSNFEEQSGFGFKRVAYEISGIISAPFKFINDLLLWVDNKIDEFVNSLLSIETASKKVVDRTTDSTERNQEKTETKITHFGAFLTALSLTIQHFTKGTLLAYAGLDLRTIEHFQLAMKAATGDLGREMIQALKEASRKTSKINPLMYMLIRSEAALEKLAYAFNVKFLQEFNAKKGIDGAFNNAMKAHYQLVEIMLRGEGRVDELLSNHVIENTWNLMMLGVATEDPFFESYVLEAFQSASLNSINSRMVEQAQQNYNNALKTLSGIDQQLQLEGESTEGIEDRKREVAEQLVYSGLILLVNGKITLEDFKKNLEKAGVQIISRENYETTLQEYLDLTETLQNNDNIENREELEQRVNMMRTRIIEMTKYLSSIGVLKEGEVEEVAGKLGMKKEDILSYNSSSLYTSYVSEEVLNNLGSLMVNVEVNGEGGSKKTVNAWGALVTYLLSSAQSLGVSEDKRIGMVIDIAKALESENGDVYNAIQSLYESTDDRDIKMVLGSLIDSKRFGGFEMISSGWEAAQRNAIFFTVIATTGSSLAVGSILELRYSDKNSYNREETAVLDVLANPLDTTYLSAYYGKMIEEMKYNRQIRDDLNLILGIQYNNVQNIDELDEYQKDVLNRALEAAKRLGLVEDTSLTQENIKALAEISNRIATRRLNPTENDGSAQKDNENEFNRRLNEIQNRIMLYEMFRAAALVGQMKSFEVIFLNAEFDEQTGELLINVRDDDKYNKYKDIIISEENIISSLANLSDVASKFTEFGYGIVKIRSEIKDNPHQSTRIVENRVLILNDNPDILQRITGAHTTEQGLLSAFENAKSIGNRLQVNTVIFSSDGITMKLVKDKEGWGLDNESAAKLIKYIFEQSQQTNYDSIGLLETLSPKQRSGIVEQLTEYLHKREDKLKEEIKKLEIELERSDEEKKIESLRSELENMRKELQSVTRSIEYLEKMKTEDEKMQTEDGQKLANKIFLDSILNSGESIDVRKAFDIQQEVGPSTKVHLLTPIRSLPSILVSLDPYDRAIILKEYYKLNSFDARGSVEQTLGFIGDLEKIFEQYKDQIPEDYTKREKALADFIRLVARRQNIELEEITIKNIGYDENRDVVIELENGKKVKIYYDEQNGRILEIDDKKIQLTNSQSNTIMQEIIYVTYFKSNLQSLDLPPDLVQTMLTIPNRSEIYNQIEENLNKIAENQKITIRVGDKTIELTKEQAKKVLENKNNIEKYLNLYKYSFTYLKYPTISEEQKEFSPYLIILYNNGVIPEELFRAIMYAGGLSEREVNKILEL